VMHRQIALDPGPMTWHRIDAGGDLARTKERASAILAEQPT